MSPTEILAILALTTWSIYRQTRVSPVQADYSRFKMAAIYAAIGIAVGGFDTPAGWAGWALIVTSLALSFVVGVVRGRRTRVWVTETGVYSKGSALTVGLFIALIAVKFTLGATAAFLQIDDGAGFGEVLVMIAIMIAVQAEIIHRRARTIAPSAPVSDTKSSVLSV